jgi:hypothetical protein
VRKGPAPVGCRALPQHPCQSNTGRSSYEQPGRTSEITACRNDKLTSKLRAAGLGAIADLGFVGLDDSDPDAEPVITGYKPLGTGP